MIRHRTRAEWVPKAKKGLLNAAFWFGMGTTALTGATAISAQEKALSAATVSGMESGSPVDIESARAELVRSLEETLEGREVGLELGFYDQDFNLITEYERRGNDVFPIASSFKAFVVLYYYWYTPPEEWVTGPHTDIYNVAVYSHNRTTGEIIHQVGERRRQADPSLQMNDIQMFNEFLTQTVGLQHGLSGWGFGSPTEGQTDSYHQPQPVTHHGRTDYVGNVTTAQDLMNGYRFLLTAQRDPRWETDPAFRRAMEATWYQLGIFDANPQYFSRVDDAFPNRPHIGKDGILTDADLPNLGPVYTEGTIIPLDNGYLVLTYMTEGESGALVNQMLGEVRRFVEAEDQSIPGALWQNHRLRPGPEVQGYLDASNFYEHTGVPEIDRTGAVEVSFPEFINNPEYGAVVTVNLFDGTVTVYGFDENHRPVQAMQTVALVGERLPNSQRVAEDFARSPYAQNGSYYDAESGVLYMRYSPDGPLIPRHGFSPQLVGELHGFTASQGFGGLPVSTRHAALWIFTEDGRSGLHSQWTFHEVPPMDSHHYNGRRLTLESAVNEFSNTGTLPHYRRTWSHGCVNLLPSEYTRIQQYLQQVQNEGKSVGIVFSYPGFDQSSLIEAAGYQTEMDPLYAANVTNWTDRLISEGF